MQNQYNKDKIIWASLNNLNVKIEEKSILKDININLKLGENVLILGPNGSGKTTFLKLLNRSIYPVVSSTTSFKLFNKENINIWDLRKSIGFLFKEMEERVKKHVTSHDLISSGFSGTFDSRYSTSLSENQNKKIDYLINELDLNSVSSKYFHSLSDGLKRRVMLARAMVFNPQILILDEPFCNLDIKSNIILNRTLIKLMNNEVNIVYATHSLESILPGTSRVILIKEGKIINDGNAEKIIRSKVLSNLYDIEIKVIKENSYCRSIPIVK